MASVFSVLAKIQADTSNFVAGMDKAQNSVDKLTKEQKKFDKEVAKSEQGVKNLGGGFGKLKGVIAGAAAAFAATGLSQVVMSTINAASDLNESVTAIDATFGNAAGALKSFAEEANVQMGQSRTQFYTAAKTFGIFGNAAGLAQEANVEFSKELVGLASDLASFNNTTVDDAITALAAGLRGESEPLRRYGVLLSEAENQQMAMKMGIFDGNGALNQQQRVLAAHASIMEQTKIQQGDFIRTSDGLANSQRILEATTKNLKEEVGTALLPAFTELVQAVQPVIQALGPLLSDALKGLEPLITAFHSAIEPLRVALEPLVSALATVSSIVGKLADAFLPPLIKIIDKLARIADKLFIALEPVVDSLLPVLGEVIEKMVLPLFDFLAKILEGVVIPAIEAFGGFLEKYLVPHLYGLVEVFETYVLPILEEWGAWIDAHLPEIQATFERVFDAIGKAVTWFRDHVIGPFLKGLADFLGLDFSGFEEAFVRGVEKAAEGAKKVGNPYADPDYLRVIQEQSEAAGALAGDSVVTGITTALNKGEGEVRNAYREMLDVFDSEIKKQNAKLKLEGMGLSEGLISYILGDADWEQIFNVIVKYGKRAVDKVQALYDQTAEGLAEVNAKIEEYNAKLKAFTDAADSYKKAMQNAFDDFIPLATIERNLGRFEQQIEQTIDQFTAFAEQGFASGVLDESFRETMNNLLATHKSAMTEIARQRDELDGKLADVQMLKNYTNQFAEGIDSLLESAQPLSRFSEQIGEFESAVVASFDNISNNVEQGIKVGIFVDETADALRTAVKNTSKTLRTIGRQRDELAKQYDEYVRQLDSATAFRQATKEASLGYADITNIGRSARVMTKNLSVIVARTKTFQQELSTLAAMGLNRELYREIVTSGLDAGSATAKAILRGGDSAVLELNSLFEELQSVSDSLAEDSTKILYDGGVEQIQGLIDGVLSQDEELRASAEAIANSFTSQFQTSFDVATANIDSLIESIKGQQSELEATAIQLANAFKTAFQQTVGSAVTAAQAKVEAEAPATKVDNTAAIAALDTKIANAQRYIKNINNDVFEAGALKKLQGYIEERQRLVNQMQGYALGGLVSGAGTGTSDSVVARLSAGEYVMRADAVSKYGSGFMSAINSGTLPKFAKGGPVGQVRGSGKVVVQNNFQINVKAGIGDPAAIGKQVVSAIAAYEKTSGKQIL